jgi:hypothetical protein
VLAFTWDREVLRWEFTRQEDGGTLLVLTISPADSAQIAVSAAGWHLTLMGLDDYLNERDLGQDPALWQVYVDRYTSQFTA